MMTTGPVGRYVNLCAVYTQMWAIRVGGTENDLPGSDLPGSVLSQG